MTTPEIDRLGSSMLEIAAKEAKTPEEDRLLKASQDAFIKLFGGHNPIINTRK